MHLSVVLRRRNLGSIRIAFVTKPKQPSHEAVRMSIRYRNDPYSMTASRKQVVQQAAADESSLRQYDYCGFGAGGGDGFATSMATDEMVHPAAHMGNGSVSEAAVSGDAVVGYDFLPPQEYQTFEDFAAQRPSVPCVRTAEEAHAMTSEAMACDRQHEQYEADIPHVDIPVAGASEPPFGAAAMVSAAAQAPPSAANQQQVTPARIDDATRPAFLAEVGRFHSTREQCIQQRSLALWWHPVMSHGEPDASVWHSVLFKARGGKTRGNSLELPEGEVHPSQLVKQRLPYRASADIHARLADTANPLQPIAALGAEWLELWGRGVFVTRLRLSEKDNIHRLSYDYVPGAAVPARPWTVTFAWRAAAREEDA